MKHAAFMLRAYTHTDVDNILNAMRDAGTGTRGVRSRVCSLSLLNLAMYLLHTAFKMKLDQSFSINAESMADDECIEQRIEAHGRDYAMHMLKRRLCKSSFFLALRRGTAGEQTARERRAKARWRLVWRQEWQPDQAEAALTAEHFCAGDAQSPAAGSIQS